MANGAGAESAVNAAKNANKELLAKLTIGLLNAVIAAVGSGTQLLPITPIAGLEKAMIVIALVAALAGTRLGMLAFKGEWILALVSASLVVPALFFYMRILSRGGAPELELFGGWCLYFYVFLAAAYLLTQMERLIIEVVLKMMGN